MTPVRCSAGSSYLVSAGHMQAADTARIQMRMTLESVPQRELHLAICAEAAEVADSPKTLAETGWRGDA